ncbi:MAG: septum site-determining protein MinD, partial [Methanoregula sp.]
QEKTDVITKKMEKVLGVPVIGIIPEDSNTRRASSAKVPIVIKYPSSPASLAIKRIAADLAGVEMKEENASPAVKEGFVDRFTRVLFKRKEKQ